MRYYLESLSMIAKRPPCPGLPRTDRLRRLGFAETSACLRYTHPLEQESREQTPRCHSRGRWCTGGCACSRKHLLALSRRLLRVRWRLAQRILARDNCPVGGFPLLPGASVSVVLGRGR